MTDQKYFSSLERIRESFEVFHCHKKLYPEPIFHDGYCFEHSLNSAMNVPTFMSQSRQILKILRLDYINLLLAYINVSYLSLGKSLKSPSYQNMQIFEIRASYCRSSSLRDSISQGPPILMIDTYNGIKLSEKWLLSVIKHGS